MVTRAYDCVWSRTEVRDVAWGSHVRLECVGSGSGVWVAILPSYGLLDTGTCTFVQPCLLAGAIGCFLGGLYYIFGPIVYVCGHWICAQGRRLRIR